MVEYANELHLIASASGSLQGEGIAEFLAGESELFSGRIASARQHLQAAVALLERAGATAAQVFAIQQLAECVTASDDQERARRLLHHGLGLARSSQLAPHLVVRMHEGLVRTGAGSSARAAIRAGEEDLTGQLFCRPCSIGFRLASATALAELGHVGLSQRQLALADDIAAMWSDGFWHAAVIEARGVLGRARGDEAEAARLTVEAADHYADLDRPFDEARCRLQAARGRPPTPASPQTERRRPTPVAAEAS
jgi:hypothetical protein